jgi:hypothetical protein
MTAKLRWFAISLLAIAAPATSAFAQVPADQVPCGPRDAVVEQLGRTFDEAPAGRGVMLEGALLELFVSPKGTWTVLITNPDKTTCLATAGEAWQGADDDEGPAQQLRGSKRALGAKRRMIDILFER